ncbi:MAG: hypothetical protein QGH15_24125, partial [Kiritimatiellia bacterium]|nr:hypothetical protein [Kiritimatiellia bacterium]
MNPQKVCENLRFFDVFSARRTFAMGPRMAQALKNQENKMLFTTFYAQIKNTLWFCLLLVPPSTTSPGSPGSLSTAATISKSNENTMCFNTFCRKALKTQGFSMVWERGLGV